MSQATVIGLCNDNIATILEPSSTIQDGCYNSGSITLQTEPIEFTSSVLISAPSQPVLITGSVVISGVGSVIIGTLIQDVSGPFATFVSSGSVRLIVSGSVTGSYCLYY